MKQLNLKITGTSPLLLSCDKLANPILPETKSQWNGLMYWDEDKKEVYLPSQNIRAALVGGAKLNKLGMQVKRGTLMLEERITLDYGKKSTKVQLLDQGYIDSQSVVELCARVILHPCLTVDIGWSLSFALQYDETILDEQQLIQAFENAGAFIGIGGFRPEKGGVFGRFDIAKVA